MKATKKDSVVRGLENNISLYNMNLKSDPNHADSYYLKGVDYVKLFKHTKNDGYAMLALEAFNKAVELTDEQNTTYLADRSKLHVAMGNNDLAVRDIAIISKLPTASGIEGFYANNTVENIARLKVVQDSVNKLSASGKIPKELAEAINSHAKVTASLVVQVDEHGKRIGGHEDRIKKLELIVDIIENKLITREQIATITRELEAMDRKVAEHEVRITHTEAELSKLADKWGMNQQSMEEMKTELEALEIDYDNMLTAIDRIVENMRTMESNISSMEAQDTTNAELQRVLSDPYKASFYYELRSELNATYMAAMVVQTDIVKNSKTGTIGDVGEALKTASAFIPVFGSAVGFFSTVLSMVDKAKQKDMVKRYSSIAVSAEDMDKMSEKIALSLLSGNFLQEAALKSQDSILEMCVGIFTKAVDVMSLYQGSVVSTAVAAAEEEITNRTQSMGADFILNFKKNTGKKITKFFTKVSKYSSSSSSSTHNELSPFQEHVQEEVRGRFVESAAQGVHELVSSYTTDSDPEKERGKNDASIVANIIISLIYAGQVKSFANIDEVSEEVTTLVKNEYGFEDVQVRLVASTEELTPVSEKKDEELQADHPDQEKLSDSPSGGTIDCCIPNCTVSYITSITYDNEMLNHPELLQIAASKYGSEALSKLTALGMDKEVAEEILANIQTQGVDQVFDILFGGPNSDGVEESTDSANECVTRDITEKLIGSVIGNTVDGFFAS